MANLEIIEDADFSQVPNAKFLSLVSGVTCMLLLGGTQAESVVNRPLGGSGGSASVTGTPVYGDGYAEFISRLNYMTLPFATTPSITIGGVFRSFDTFVGDANCPGIIGNTPSSIGMYVHSTATAAPACRINGDLKILPAANKGVNITVPDFSRWTHLALGNTEGVGQHLRSVTDGLVAESLYSEDRDLGTLPLYAGSISAGGFTGEIDCAIAFAAPFELTLAQLKILDGQFRTILALHGEVLPPSP